MDEIDLSQKRRNRAIAITDIAIKKVPRTQLFGFSDEQNAFIQEQHKELLKIAKELCKKYNNNTMEVAILIDINKWDTWVVEGKEERKVSMKDNPEANQYMQTASKNSCMLMHNHPSTGTFSGEDFKTFCNTESLYFITVVGNDGSIYVLMKNYNFNSEYALKKYGEFAEKYKNRANNGTLAIREILKNARLYGLSYKFGRKKLLGRN